uniref:Uncharacterized protein n=1 Tax=Arundo donax TaxID=35708 RepID=A0A0A9BHK0_ARUDO
MIEGRIIPTSLCPILLLFSKSNIIISLILSARSTISMSLMSLIQLLKHSARLLVI